MRRAWRALIVLALPGCADKLPSGPAGVPGRLVFATNRNFGQWDLYLMNPNGTNMGQLDPSLANDLWANWSPDGNRIVFQSDRIPQAGDSVNYNIFVIGVDGTGLTKLTTDLANDIQPAWSPDGTKIAFATDRDSGDYEVYVMGAAGTNPVRLTTMPGEDGQPAWSPDGSKLAFAHASPTDSISDIFVMNAADGSNPVNLTPGTGAFNDVTPAWSPDGTKLAFASERSGQLEIWVMNADGTNPRQLTRGSAPAEFPSWSPDGAEIAYDSDGHIWIMYADGSQPTRITKQLYADVIPRWRPTP